ncbi:DUF58 domain-containing protein [Natronogracilivirga saccharolytica]|uniref:DUF58 domain-containing protein n=1 Tax=Natronogracilivirga saccharolytica TaxID=2812953 RepID=A0A8J7S7K4_9BACT|nr:DUF58 domain-containing protein [Natronogracilivirga saccharolytica]MBP3193438.1 DUF58 domain-containing protein [Natronogracilivirga saccharolytica]
MLLSPELLNRLTPLEIKARQIVEGFISGLHKSPFFGFSVEFAEHRPYHPGDDLKHLDWKVYGKRERYFVKQYEEETNLRCYMLMDVSSSMQFRYFADWSKLRYGVHLGAAMAYMLHRQRDGCGLAAFDREIGEIIPAKSSYGHLLHLYKNLEQILDTYDGDVPQKRQTASAEAIHQLAERINRRSLVIILTDLFENVQKQDELISALKHLRHKKHEVILFHLLEKRSERELDFPDDRYVFSDLETGGEMDVVPRQIRKDYQKKMKEYTKNFRITCSDANISYEEVDTQDPFDYALLAFLNKRRRLM